MENRFQPTRPENAPEKLSPSIKVVRRYDFVRSVEIRRDLVDIWPDLFEIGPDVVEIWPDLFEISPDLFEISPDLVEICQDLFEIGLSSLRSAKLSSKSGQIQQK